MLAKLQTPLHKTARHDVSVSVRDKLYLYTGTPIRSEYECDEALARLIYINATCCCIFGKGEKLNAQKSTVKEKICLIFHLLLFFFVFLHAERLGFFPSEFVMWEQTV